MRYGVLRNKLLWMALLCLAAGGLACSMRGKSGAPVATTTYKLAHEPVMGSGFHAIAIFPVGQDARASKALADSLQAALDLEKKISKYDAASEVRRSWDLKPGETVRISRDTAAALELSIDLWKRSGGAFDCTVEPLIELYKYTGKEERMPTDEEIAAARAKVGSDKIVHQPGSRRVGFTVPGMRIDLGAVGQGLGADVACEVLAKAGASGALVELGGEVRTFGQKAPGVPWRVEVKHPRTMGQLTIVELSGGAISTSGDYEKYFKKAGRRASHILDARTGKPLIGGAVSVTIIAPECALADGLATAVSALGPVEGMKLVEGYCAGGKPIEALIIEETADGKLVPYMTAGLKDKLKLNMEPVAEPKK